METITCKPLESIWLKASVVGSIWASVEIILGSFLHNMKLPMSGMILSFISVWLLISFITVWKETGLIWRAGLVCALMKSISPSAFIFGPMIGIFTEALLLYFFIFIFGKNLFAYATGGALAVLSTLFQKIISLLILYGFDIIKILADLYKYAVKQIGFEQLSPLWLLVLIAGIYIAAGITGAIGGYLTGLRYFKSEDRVVSQSEIDLNSKSQFISQPSPHSYSVLFLLINLFSIAGILLLINSGLLILTTVFSVVYIGFCIFNYRNSLKRLKKISFWITFLVITFAAAFLWSGFQEGAFFSVDGLLVGLKMNARAIIMMIGFASISVELRNPVIKSLLYNKGFANLYQSMNLAFSALPFLISNPSKTKTKQYFPGISFNKLLNQAEMLLQIFQNDHAKKPHIVIITGEIHEGKTTFAQKIVDNLIERKISIGGFLSVSINENGERVGFNLRDIESGELIELCTNKRDDNRLHLGRYYFNRDAILKGSGILSSEKISDKQLIVIDEIGPLELNGQGWSSAIEEITRNFNIPQLWVVRKSILNKIIKRWNIGDVYVFNISEDNIPEVENKIAELISSRFGTAK
jgi:nucleoside-triphosphatase THEP1